MFPSKLYLGKWQHAKDGEMITTLGITHILNISDSCENYLEDSHPNLTYLQLVVADEQDKPIQNVFEQIYDFILTNTEPSGDEEVKIDDVDLASMAYPNSTATVLLNYQTHANELQMSAQELQYSRIMQHYNSLREQGAENAT